MSKYGHIPHNWFEGLLNKMGGEDVAKAYLRGEFELTKIAKAVQEHTKYINDVTVTFVRDELGGFVLETQQGLWVSPEIASILGTKVIVPSVEDSLLKKHTILKPAYDRDVVCEIGQGVWFKGEEDGKLLVAIITSMVKKQWGGTPCELQNNGIANLFYYKDENGKQCVLGVYWHSHGKTWNVGVWGFDGSQRLAEFSVFSRN